MRDLVPFALRLRQLSGSYDEARGWLEAFTTRGTAAARELGLHGDAALVLTANARDAGLFTATGAVDRVRSAQLVLVLDLLSAVPEPAPDAPAAQPLVFTVPRAAASLVTLAQRLDLLITDVIACAQATLHIGGPFWNEGGWELLRPVLLPALEQRGVAATFYLHPHESGHLHAVRAVLDEAAAHGSVRTLWWAGGFPSLMHAKFVIADAGRGYFGSANLTSLGLGEHLEMGVELKPEQSASLLGLLDALERSSLFATESPR